MSGAKGIEQSDNPQPTFHDSEQVAHLWFINIIKNVRFMSSAICKNMSRVLLKYTHMENTLQ